MQAQNKIPIPTQRRVLKVDKEILNCSPAQGNLWQLNTKDVQEITKFQKVQKTQKSNLATSFPYFARLCCVPHREKVFSIVRKIYDWNPTDNLKGLDVNTAIWGIFMTVTLQAAVHLGRD